MLGIIRTESQVNTRDYEEKQKQSRLKERRRSIMGYDSVSIKRGVLGS